MKDVLKCVGSADKLRPDQKAALFVKAVELNKSAASSPKAAGHLPASVYSKVANFAETDLRIKIPETAIRKLIKSESGRLTPQA